MHGRGKNAIKIVKVAKARGFNSPCSIDAAIAKISPNDNNNCHRKNAPIREGNGLQGEVNCDHNQNEPIIR